MGGLGKVREQIAWSWNPHTHMSILDMSTPREPTEQTGNLLGPAEAAKGVNGNSALQGGALSPVIKMEL